MQRTKRAGRAGPIAVPRDPSPSRPAGREVLPPGGSPVEQLLFLQRTVGNRALEGVRQAVSRNGQPLDADTRVQMEARFGRDFDRVRVHTDAGAAESASAIHAQAYTIGQDVVFAAGEYAPDTTAGRTLLAHELAHTIQQRRDTGAPPSNDPHGVHETTARSAAQDVASGAPAQAALPASGVGLSMAPADDRAIAAAEAVALVERMDREEQAEAERDRREEEERNRRSAGRPTTLSLLRQDPRFEAAQISDDQIYLSAEEQRAKAAAEAEATIAVMNEEEALAEEEEKQEEAERERYLPGRPRTLSLLDPAFEASLVTDEAIYESVREPRPEEPEYWERQEQEWLDKPIHIAKDTRYVRTWHTVTIEGRGDQGDKHVDVEESHWNMTGPALRGYLQYAFGTLTPFEESLARGEVDVQEGFVVVQAGEGVGYFTEWGGSGMRHHRIYNRDGTVFREWTSEAPLVNMGIGPIALALPGIGIRGLARTGGALVRTGVAAGTRLLKPLGAAANRGLLTTKLLLGRAEAGAAMAESTALGGAASRTSMVLAESRLASAAAPRTAAQSAARLETQSAAVPSLPSTTTAGARPALPTAPTVTQPLADVATTATAVTSQVATQQAVQMDPRHARGYAGEQSMGFNLYPAEQGWMFIEGPSGAVGHGVTTSGFDGLAYNPRLDILDIVDNKSLRRAGNVSSATAIDPAKNLGQNLDAAIQRVQQMTDLPHQARILQLLRDTRQALTTGVPRPSQVRLVVTHQGGRTTGVSSTLSGRGLITR